MNRPGVVGAQEPIAIVGIGCRLPGGIVNPESLWRVLEGKVDAIQPVPTGRWDVERYYSPKPQQPGRMNAREAGFLEQVNAFDAAFFGISPRIAEQMDPQQRLLLEVCWEAFEDAGLVPEKLARSQTGVFMGVCSQDYGGIQSAPGEIDGLGAHSATGTFLSIVSNRLSYTFDLRGPSMSIDTACSSSLVAVHLACQSLWKGESTLAVAGGVNLMLTPQFAITLSQAAMLSPDCRSKAFDASANGYVRGEGSGVVILKPLAQALRDEDRIYAVIRGTAVNQDGRTQGITVPNGEAQEANFRQALAQAGVSAREVGYVEAHGTGTSVGDPIEANALGRVLSEGREEERVAYVGSIKTNIGHLEAGAGIAGLIKATLAIHHRRIPPNLHFQVPNPEIDFQRWRMSVPTETTPWPTCYEQALASINSFGFGGTNANVVLGEAPTEARTKAPSRQEPTGAGASLLTLSARSEQALQKLAQAHAERLERQEGDLEQLAAFLALRRGHHGHRLAIVATDARDAAAKLRAYVGGQPTRGVTAGSAQKGPRGKVAFLFNGQGPQWWAMGRTLLETSPVFREKILECDALARKFIDWSIHQALTVPDEGSSSVQETRCLQPMMFAIQVALVELWKSWGVTPDGVAGHSMGEIAAAHVSGSLDLETALKVICHRARIQEKADPEGGMMFVALPRDEAVALCEKHENRLWLSAENSPRSSTLSGPRALLGQVSRELKKEVFARLLRVNCACHSPQMDPLQDELMQALGEIGAKDSTLPLYSTTLGHRVEGSTLSASHWWENFRRPVLFAPTIRAMLQDGFDTFIELSPHPVLFNSLTELFEATGNDALALSSLHRKKKDWDVFLGALSTLYTAGGTLDWARRYPRAASLELPTNPWLREVFWNESKVGQQYRAGGQPHPMLKRVDAALPTWEIRWDDYRLGWVKEHEVFGSVIVPGAASVEAALVATRELTGEPCALEFVDFERPCILTAGEPKVSRVVVDAEEGSFELYNRSVQDDRWVRNVKGRFYRAPLGGQQARPLDLEAIRARCTRVHKPLHIYELMRRKGYNYGPTFCGISKLYVGHREALARVEPPRLLKEQMRGYLLHPALLDACLQSAILHPGEHGDELLPFTYLPTDLQRVRVYGELRFPAWCFTRVRKLDATGLSVDISLLDERGNVMAELGPLHGKVVRDTSTELSDRLEQHLYRLSWKAQPGTRGGRASSALRHGPADVKARLQPLCEPLSQRLGREAYRTRYQEELRQLCAAYVGRCLRALGRELEEGESFRVEEFSSLLPKYKRAFTKYLGFLVQDGTLRERDGVFHVERAGLADPERLWADMALQYPSCSWELLLLRKTGGRLKEVLTGEVEALSLLFPEGSLEGTEPIYQGSPIARFYNLLVKQAVEHLAKGADERRTLRVLEVGAGTGGLTAHVLPVLPPERCEYVFTDVSVAFAQSAREKFGEHGFVEYRSLDLEKDLHAQGFVEGSFDLVLASDVLHATTDLKKTLLQVQGLLAPGGMLALIEAMPDNRWLELTFGLTDGWWHFRDLRLRKDGPLLAARAWEKLLHDVGYDEVEVLSDPDHEGAGAQAVLLARAPSLPAEVVPADAVEVGPPHLKDWLIFTDTAGLGEDLARRISQRGGRAILVRPGECWSAFGDARTLRPGHAEDHDRLLEGLELEGVIHLWNTSPDTGPLDAAKLEQAIRVGSLSVSELIKALDRKAPQTWPRLFVLTRGAQSLRNRTPSLEGAPVWGLLLSASLELPWLRCRTIDLDVVAPVGEATAVWSELWRDDHEREVALRDGERFTRRLVGVPPQAAQVPVDARALAPDMGFALETETPGPLDQLRYHAVKRAAPKPGQVELEVVVSALNYLDVMTALGQVPILESEHRHRFGAECTGIITRVGEGVDTFKPGDQVIAVSSTQGTLASHLTLDATCVFPKPKGMSFEEAASLPIVFLTSWYALRKLARLEKGEKVLIHSATGGTGLAALQIARMVGAEIFATAGSPEKREYLRALGVEHVMDSRSLDFADEVMRLTGGTGVDVILNTIAGEAVARGISCLAPYGRFVEIGKRDLLADRKLGLRSFLQNLAYFSFDLRQLLHDRPRAVRAEFQHLLELFEQGVLRPLPHRVFHPSQTVAAFRQMVSAKHIGKLLISLDERELPVMPARELAAGALRGTWLIAGGLGGFGLAMAESLAGAGVRHLVLIGRSAIGNEEARRKVEALRARGVNVVARAVDVTSRDALKALLEQLSGELPPLQGVLHCAMVLDDVLLTQLDEASMMKVIRPKVLGAWHLHELTAHLSLEAFVLFSSATSMIGNRGQGNYAVANTFLDHLAQARRAQGLKALAVNWGAVSDAGYVARHEKVGKRVAATGMQGFTSTEAFRVLSSLWSGSHPQVGVLPMDWEQFFGYHGFEPGTQPRYEAVGAASAGGAELNNVLALKGSLLQQLRHYKGAQRRDFLKSQLRTRVATVLGVPHEALDEQMPLIDYLDSLLAVEISAWIERELNAKVTILELMKGPSVEQLTTQLLPQLGTR
jgi:acyl transferase domain-containing protein/NADPH:quinone reductase-like Zn-dependent oxidoreductase/NAD(P)-dependent dehydrogenase (short-subunit alcohol dehydrogenase family)/aryl carrier-like protein